MKSHHPFIRRATGMLFCLGVLLVAGCLEKRLIWAPDGSRAVVISSDGLYLCGTDGHLSDLLVPNVRVAAWFPDSRQLAVVRQRDTQNLDEVLAALGDERAWVESEAEKRWAEFADRPKQMHIDLDSGQGQRLPAFVMARRHAAELRSIASPDEVRKLEAVSVTVRELVLASVEKDRVVVGPVLHKYVNDIVDVRISPTGAALAWTQERASAKDEFDLMVSLVATPQPKRVARNTAAYPDWQTDGRALVYVESPKAEGPQPEDSIVLGVLIKREVLDDQGRIAIGEKPEYLAGLLFNVFTHVRCLRDGRVLFNAVEMSLPLSAADYGGDQREQLFAVDAKRQATLVRLIPRRNELSCPQALAFFEVSPDDSQVAIGGNKSEVAILTLATGEVNTVQAADKDSPPGVATWRRAGELTYVKRIKDKEVGTPSRPLEVILRTDEKETVLSRSWSDDVLKKVVGSDR